MTAAAYDGIILMGPPGSGKSHLGRLLRTAGVARYIELEPILLDRFGTGAAFAAHKAEALAFIAASIEGQLADRGPPAVIETTGLSDRPMLLDMAARWRLAMVAVRTPKALCLARVAARAGGRNLSNDPEATARAHDHWTRVVAPGYAFDLEIEGLDADHDGARIIEALLR